MAAETVVEEKETENTPREQVRPDSSLSRHSSTSSKKSYKSHDRGRFSLRRLFGRSKSYKGEKKPESVVRKPSGESCVICPVCYAQRPRSLFPDISTCEHRSCIECLRQYMTIEINESRVNLTCPECSERFHPNDIKYILNDDTLMNKYDEFTLRRVLVSDPDCRWCPAPDCGYAVIATGCASCPKLQCERPGCKTEFCYHCKQLWHPNLTCDSARYRRATLIRTLVSDVHQSSHSSNDDMKPCPRCSAFIIKMDDGSCNHMTCAVCGAEFCWLCMKEISDLHYLSPSGCTFWGKKPWSRKKKILWQMGTLIGAPLGIALAAGVVLPAMVIGIPVYVGRQIRDKYEKPFHSARKRNIAITGGVTISVLISPILAALTVGIGVPIALGYIYGVVPVSLCRSGGCATVMSTRNGRGVNLDFDEESEPPPGGPGPSTFPFGVSRSSSRVSVKNGDRSNGKSSMVTVVATVNNTDTESGKQPSLTMSQDASSLDSQPISQRVINDNDSHASLFPAPRSCTASITSSFDNFNVNASESIASSSIAEVMDNDSCCVDQYSLPSNHGNVDKDNLSVLESVGSHDD
ncbi:E3 ubiquitin-protein ligase RNF19A-like [Nematostella vectensis]|uniref:E3 ubiquitin-protein ligase RNF19A-like n=1 Tax=Nematostella vectensis TaxID=45351 RepID=UPI002076D810|nr:E3 ubiquitin-protein ligase RNF19A-like [Nematostella vectensis]XP_048590417.1 E3 ubiquitin-protein ligase RNF19A-like [Nematostella vectensis]